MNAAQEALELTAQLVRLRPCLTDAELLRYADLIQPYLSRYSRAQLIRATERFAKEARVVTPNSIRYFVHLTCRRPMRVAAESQCRERKAAQVEATCAKTTAALDWERRQTDDASAYWRRLISDVHPSALDEVLQEWRDAGRGRP